MALEGYIDGDRTWERIESGIRFAERLKRQSTNEPPPGVITPGIVFVKVTGAADEDGYYPADISYRNPDSALTSSNWYELEYDASGLVTGVNPDDALSPSRRYAAVMIGYREGNALLLALSSVFTQLYVMISGYDAGYYYGQEARRTAEPEDWEPLHPTVPIFNISRPKSNFPITDPLLDDPVPPLIPNGQVILVLPDPWNAGKWVIAGACGGMTAAEFQFMDPSCVKKKIALSARDLVFKVSNVTSPPPPPPPPPISPGVTDVGPIDVASGGKTELFRPGILSGAVTDPTYWPEITAVSSGTVTSLGPNGELYYTAPTGPATTTVTFRLTDGTNTTATANVTFNVFPPTPATVSNHLKNFNVGTLNEEDPGVATGANMPLGYRFELVSAPGLGTLWFFSDGTYKYKAPGSTGSTSFTYRATNGTTSSSNGTVTINIV